MALKQINIDQQMAQIGIRSTPARMQISNGQRMTMRVSNQAPQMQLESSIPKFRVNRRKLNSEMNVHSPIDFTKKHRDMGQNAVMRGIRDAGSDGDFLGDARRSGQQIGQLARSKSMSSALRKRDFNIGLMPQSGAELNWEKGYVNINWSDHSVVIDWDGDYMPQVTLEPRHSVESYLRTEPYIRISVGELLSPGRPGQYINRTI